MRLDWQRRAVILFAAFLLVLSVVLVFFALREAERERLLDERDLEGRQRRLAESIDARAGALIRETEDRVLRTAEKIKADAGATHAASALKDILSDVPLVSETFTVDNAGHIAFSGARPLFLLPGERPWSREVAPAQVTDDRWRRAEEAEFRLNDPSLAASLYREMATGTSDHARRALLLNREARCLARAGRQERAVAVYREQLRAGLPGLTTAGIPLEILALYQIGNIRLQQGRAADAAGALLEFYRGLLEATWPLTKDQFESFQNWAEDRFQAAVGGMKAGLRADWEGRFLDLKQAEQGLLEYTRRLEIVAERIVPRIRLEAGGMGADAGIFRHIAERGGDAESLLASFAPLSGGIILGMLLDGHALVRGLFAPDPRISEMEDGLSAVIVDEAGKHLAGPDIPLRERPAEKGGSEPVLTASFTDSFPPWTIQVHQERAGTVERRFRAKRTLYLLSLAAVVAALSFGGFLAIRSTAKELKLARMKSDFAATVSHEFRTPLTSIRYLSELLQRGRVPDEDRKQEYYGTITGESERLSRLVENLLDFSKIESGMKEYTLGGTDVAALVSGTAERFRRQAGPRPLSLETEIADGLPSIRADKDALGRALFNLLDNAMKYSGGDPRIVLRAWSEDGAVFLRVEDSGIGIGKAEQKKVFEKFYRSERAMERNVKGSGIGLTLVEHAVKAHGGTVSLDSAQGRGTWVTVRIPSAPAGFRKGNEHG